MGLRMAEPCAAAAQSTMLPLATSAWQWYAVQVTPRHEKKVAFALKEKRLPGFLPLVSEVHYWSDRKKTVETPLFAGYTFVVLSANEDRIATLRTPGVVRLAGKEHIGTPIPAKQIEDITILINSRLKLDPHPFLNVGDRVRIRTGSLTGVEGVLVGKNADATLVVSIDLLQRSLAVHIHGFDVERLGPGVAQTPNSPLVA